MDLEQVWVRQRNEIRGVLAELMSDPRFKDKRLVYCMEYNRRMFNGNAEEISKKQFMNLEPNMLPLCLGTQFGLVVPSMDAPIGSRYVVILGRSALSGTLGGLKVYEGDEARSYKDVGKEVLHLTTHK